MKLVSTLIVRDEADIVGAQIAYHLNAGVDFVIAVDHESQDGTTDILEGFARDGYLLRLPESGPVLEDAWRTRMARLAATEYGADWVIPADADEFWLPRHCGLRETLAAVPERYGVLGGLICHFVPRPDDGRMFAERMTTRLAQSAPVNDPTSPMRSSLKALFRADPDVTVLHASFWIKSEWLRPLPGWNLFDVLHFPCRSVAQWGRKTSRRGHADADKPLGQYVKGLEAVTGGWIDDLYQSLVVDGDALARGLADGVLVQDVRIRGALRALAFPGSESSAEEEPATAARKSSAGPASAAAAAAIRAAAEDTALYDANLVRFLRNVDSAAARADALERRSSGPVRLLKGLRRTLSSQLEADSGSTGPWRSRSAAAVGGPGSSATS